MTIDINSDVGEGMGNESLLMPYVSSCNIACGGHAGDVKSMLEMLAFAKANKLKVGAHPSYPDKANFGRKMLDISNDALKSSIIAQITTLKNLAEATNQKLHHVKPHGALYNLAARDEQIAKLVVDSIAEIDDSIKLYVPYNSLMSELAEKKLKTVVEGFADRAYNEDYSLVSRSEKGSVLTNPEAITERVIKALQEKSITTINGKVLPFYVDTFCIHSDTPNAIVIAKSLYERLGDIGIAIQ